jgi:hypothetical protein
MENRSWDDIAQSLGLSSNTLRKRRLEMNFIDPNPSKQAESRATNVRNGSLAVPDDTIVRTKLVDMLMLNMTLKDIADNIGGKYSLSLTNVDVSR